MANPTNTIVTMPAKRGSEIVNDYIPTFTDLFLIMIGAMLGHMVTKIYYEYHLARKSQAKSPYPVRNSLPKRRRKDS